MKMTKHQRGDADLLILAAVLIALVAAITGLVIVTSYYSCHSKWDRAGMVAVEYGPLQGCLVKMPDGRWLPSDRVREFDLPRPVQK